jgi:hypothetical protein
MAKSAKASNVDTLYEIRTTDGTGAIMARSWLRSETGTGMPSIRYYPPVGDVLHVLQGNVNNIVFLGTNEIVFSPEMDRAKEKEEKKEKKRLLKNQAKEAEKLKKAAAKAVRAAAKAAKVAAAASAAAAAAADSASDSEGEEEEA